MGALEKFSFRYGEQRIHYQINRVSEKQSKVAIHGYHDGVVSVDAPLVSDIDSIKKAVIKRSSWIAKHVEQAAKNKKQVLKRDYVSGESHFYLG
jgi:predicted metal-dependent hydrolase